MSEARHGNPSLPLVQARGGKIGNDTEVTAQTLLDDSSPLAGLPGQVLTSGGTGGGIYWSTPSSSTTTPTFTSFSITGQTTPLEVGATVAAGATPFVWATSNSSSVAVNSISIVDTTASATLASGLANTGSDSITISAITNNVPASQIWTVNGLSTGAVGFSRTYEVDWFWRVYAGDSSNATLTANQIKALTASSNLQAAFAGSYTISPSSDFSYFCYPDSLGSVNFFKDGNTGFPISMATVADNGAYSNTANGWSYAIVSVTNAQSIATNYRVYRTQYSFTGTLIMVVS